MEEEKQVTETTQEQPSGDNLLDVLDDFNQASAGPDPSAPVEAQEQPQEGSQETTEEPAVQENAEEGKATDWLIEGKFTDDDDGKQKLAKSYKEMQSLRDKDRNEYQKSVQGMARDAQIGAAIRQNPKMAQAALNAAKAPQQDPYKAPAKPASYDILEEQIEGTDSHKWRQAQDAYLIRMGQAAGISEVNKLRQEINNEKQIDAKIHELKALGLKTDEEIMEYANFLQEMQGASDDKLVNAWRQIKGQPNQQAENVQTQEETPAVPAGRTSAAAVSGSTPPAPTTEAKEVDEFWGGIMNHSQKQ